MFKFSLTSPAKASCNISAPSLARLIGKGLAFLAVMALMLELDFAREEADGGTGLEAQHSLSCINVRWAGGMKTTAGGRTVEPTGDQLGVGRGEWAVVK